MSTNLEEKPNNKTSMSHWIFDLAAMNIAFWSLVLVAIIIAYIGGIIIPDQKPRTSDSNEKFIELVDNVQWAFVKELTDNINNMIDDISIPSPAQLEGEALYRKYAYDITSTYYPDVPPEYVIAIMYHESRFDPTVVNSKSGAVGLMQTLPKWHLSRAEKLGVELADPYGNILVGCDILNEVYRQSNSITYALDVYAGGYGYANAYKNTTSPFRAELNEIMLMPDFLRKE